MKQEYVIDEATTTSLAHSSASHSSSTVIDKQAEKKLLRKIDILILPVFFLFYLLSYLDRINLGNARIQGMNAELQLAVDNRYNVTSLLFYVLYIPFEVPSNLLLHYVRPSFYLPGIMFCWGIVTMCNGFVQSYKQLYALRILLGLFEAGLVPGVVFISSMYYKRFEFQTRLSLMFVATSVGGAFGGLLAYAISNLSGDRGYLGWRWIFIIEGAFTAFIALLAPLVMVDLPQKCRFFSKSEKEMISVRLAEDASNFKMDAVNSFTLKLVFGDYKLYLGAFTYMGLTTSGLAMSVFLPTVLLEFGYKGERAQIYTIPIYLFCLVLTLILSALSDKLKHRYGFIMFCLLLSTVGYSMLLNVTKLSVNAKYGACFLVAAGGICSGPLSVVFLSNNLSGHLKRSVGSAMQVSFAGFAGIIGSYMFLDKEAPVYHTAFSVGLGLAWVSGLAATTLAVLTQLENRRRDQGKRDYRLTWSADRVDNLGDDHPGFKYAL